MFQKSKVLVALYQNCERLSANILASASRLLVLAKCRSIDWTCTSMKSYLCVTIVILSWKSIITGHDQFVAKCCSTQCVSSRGQFSGVHPLGRVVAEQLSAGQGNITSVIPTGYQVCLGAWNKYQYYRVAGLSWYEAGGCKWSILRGFPDVLGSFGP